MKKNLFEKRINVLPYEYPELLKYKDAIRHSYWIHTEYNITEDVSDYLSKVTKTEQEAIKRCMLAIAQIEVNVKAFWGDLYKRMPKSEIQAIGATFSESEVRHFDAYQFLLERLGLQKEFEKILEVPAIQDRINYLTKYLDGTRSKSDKMYTKSVLLFSLFIEHVSLFSQFLILMSFNKEKNLFKGISNIVESTSKEEDVHGNFGSELINIIRKENPEWFDAEFYDLIYSACQKAYDAECKVLEWIFEKGELDFLPIEVIKEFIKKRFNDSLDRIGMGSYFKIDLKLLEPTLWFEVEIKSTKEGDFFYKKQIDYNKKSKSITNNDLF
tara:strand:+ start:26662 stop:27642 length:981 start_codon:yes stop_codon:yes gene_type:complete